MPIARRPISAQALRADLITSLMGPLFLWGEPLIGKTTLVRQVLWSLEPQRFLVCRLPIGSLAEPIMGECRAAELLLSQIKLQLQSGAFRGLTLRATKNLRQALEQCLLAGLHSYRTLVLVVEGLDRYRGGMCPLGILENMAFILQRLSDLSLVCTARVPVEQLEGFDLPNPRIHQLTPLGRQESTQLLLEPLRDRLSFHAEALDCILSAAGGRPYLLQSIGRNCWRISEPFERPELSLDHAREIVNCGWPAGEHLFRSLLGNLTRTTQHVLAGVALTSHRRSPSTSAMALRRFLERCGISLPPKTLAAQIALLRALRLVEFSPPDRLSLTIGWLGDFLRAGRLRKPPPVNPPLSFKGASQQGLGG